MYLSPAELGTAFDGGTLIDARESGEAPQAQDYGGGGVLFGEIASGLSVVSPKQKFTMSSDVLRNVPSPKHAAIPCANCGSTAGVR